VPSGEVYTRTLVASKGHNKISAITSAEPDATDHPIYRYLMAFSSPTADLKTSLKIS